MKTDRTDFHSSYSFFFFLTLIKTCTVFSLKKKKLIFYIFSSKWINTHVNDNYFVCKPVLDFGKTEVIS